MNRILKINRGQAEHSVKHNLGGIYGFDVVSKDEGEDYNLSGDDLNNDYSLPMQFEEFEARFSGENWSSKMAAFDKLIKYIK